ncbi:MAG: mannose-1-phosphate guanyltransferase [Hydrogenophilales bacterium CG03_land_8_20_14_0_80_62_28]|nr:ABC transporter permease [Betaproteobacteria bacterium]OIO78012.1 MAG: mannose-1-phosphate guanyltransferase [Hydrogenophilaceae bacterium CG1_02_62_390]PIV21704.1 MAG: mannose-1-phosphate guanyltransferase [Hydrogenophilales bacterium CG03_land_8_20_14_0_80_62_28]PIW38976.1 MAG: mannose-1-phosphate guanyltransferase [Hydrogenophilales bacterium CG15_BIG_FIL_POST_REV_8_21_14_020_62_31]PIW71407.1 MAG: mannose-1-phosphate guanyltransferase [Hydrogenophilales bacterium CG12_big_fil_rev_8_21_14_
MNLFSFSRFAAVVVKEFIQMRRDRLTFAMMVGIPLMQLLLFGFAINSDPKHLPTAVRIAENSQFARSFVAAMQNSGYFTIVSRTASEAEAAELLARGEAQFVIDIPADFARRVQRGERPAILVEADATDPAATSNALGALSTLAQTALDRDLAGPLARLKSGPPPFEVRLHRRYNPEGITQYNIVPGLMGVILTMTMVMGTGLAVTRERERGTMENLLATPVRPLEVTLGKIVPNILVALIQVTLILLASYFVFHVPMVGSLALLYACAMVFVFALLGVGITFSTLAKNQMQSMQMTMFFFLPNMMLSGFMFPFRGMPGWAQAIGEVLPLTHFLRIVRGILLKGNGLAEVLPELGPIVAFFLVVMAIALKRYRRTLD